MNNIYYGCNQFINKSFVVDTRIDTGEKCISLCCEPIENIPASKLYPTGQETISYFLDMYNRVILESKKFKNKKVSEKRFYTKACEKCAYYLPGKWVNDGLIHYINLSMYPAPCQCKCIYCSKSSYCNVNDNESKDCDKYYELMFKALEYAQKRELIAEDVLWQISSGEITIHPYKDRILSLIMNQTAAFYTNCFIYDEKIAQNLKINANSVINFSIDSGTTKTWLKIKGVDNFTNVINNLKKYKNICQKPEQIILKYILIPNINDNPEDYKSLIEIMKNLQINNLMISRDIREKYNSDLKKQQKIISTAGYLLALLIKNKINSSAQFSFTPEERQEINTYANNLLREWN